jgi:hypothetical protein
MRNLTPTPTSPPPGKAVDISQKLLILLSLSKGKLLPDMNFGWVAVNAALANYYYHQMTIRDCLMHAIEAYCEVIADPRFEVHGDIDKLLLAPIKGLHSIHFLPTGKEVYTAEEWISAQIAFVLGELSITRVDWCKSELDALVWEPYVPALPSKA